MKKRTGYQSIFNSREFKWLLAPLVLTLLIRLIWMLVTDNMLDGDAPERLRQAWMWSTDPVPFPSRDWLPFPYYMVGILLALFHDPVWVPRIVHLAFSVFTVIPLYFFVKGEFNEEIAYCTILQYTFFHTQIIFSSMTLSEPPFLFFLFGGLLALQKFKLQKKILWFVLAVVFFTVINLIRFEGWLFTLLAGVLYLLRTKDWKSFFAFGAVTSLAPLWVMYETWRMTGDPLWGLNFSDYEVKRLNTIDHVSMAVKLLVPLYGFPLLSLILVPWGIRMAMPVKNKLYLAIAFVPVTYAFWKAAWGTLSPNPRYYQVYAILLMPYSAFVYNKLYHWVKSRAAYTSILSGILFTLLILQGYPYVWVKTTKEFGLKYNEGFFESAAFARENLGASRIMLDQEDCYMSKGWMVYANAPLVNEDSLHLPGVAYWLPGRYWLDEKFDSTIIYDKITKCDINNVVLFRQGPIRKYLGFTKKLERRKNILFERVFSRNGYEIYTVVPEKKEKL